MMERPTKPMALDYAGVVYIPLNEGGWKFELAKELKNAGYPVDFNNLA